MKKKITIRDIVKMKKDGKRIPVLTAYNYPMAALVDRAGVPIILVGDSCGMVEAGYDSTLPVTVAEMIYHTRAVKRGAASALVVTDMPFMSYQSSVRDALRNAGRLVKKGGAEAVKVEGGVRSADVIRAITGIDVPVMGHVGLTPQSVHVMGGYRVQGKGKAGADTIMGDAKAVEDAGAFAVVLEGIPSKLAARITGELTIPTIGIGAGPGCDGQVLVINDMLGLNPGGAPEPKFVRKYADLNTTILTAIEKFTRDVYKGKFPGKEESYE